MSIASVRTVLGSLILLSFFTGCSANTLWRKMGYENRELLVSDVKEARDEQNKAKEEIKTTMERFKEVTGFQGGDLETKYNKLKSAYDDAESRSGKVSGRIKDVEKTAGELFEEWEEELEKYDNAELRSKSRQQLTETKAKYKQLLSVMKQAESKMKPVLKALKS